MMKNPVHPGTILKYDCLEPMAISPSEFAKTIHMELRQLELVLAGAAPISAAMAQELAKHFSPSAATWLRMQERYNQSIAQNGMQKAVSKNNKPARFGEPVAAVV